MVDEQRQQLVAVLEVVVKTAACHAETLCETVDLDVRDALVNQRPLGDLDPGLRAVLGRPSMRFFSF